MGIELAGEGASAPGGASQAPRHERFLVSVSSREGSRRWPSRGWAEYYDDQGACVRVDAPMPKGRKVVLRFKAPPSLPALGGYPVEFAGEVTDGRESPKRDGWILSVRWEKPLPALVEDSLASHRWKVGICMGLIIAVMVWLRWISFKFFWYDPVFYFYTMAVGTFFLSRFYLSFVHRPPPLKDYTPSVSIVISARNEEEAIVRTVESCFGADYPADKREVLAVDDGSTDRTRAVLDELKLRFPELRVFSIPPSGKRFGMAKGFREAKGDILVVVDSDTILDRMALRHVVSGFEDPTLGASCGTSGVANAEVNMLTRMQEVRYLLSYDLMKAPEGVFSAVTCCPGVLSAYRREYLLKILDKWLYQTFLGAPATFGDDRSLTNFLLRDYRVTYNPQAMCTTLVPETWGRYLKQQVRWKKSWLRETLIAGSFMWRKHPAAALSFYISAMCSVVSPFMVFRAMYWGWTEEFSLLVGYVLGLGLLGLSMGLFVLWRRPIRYWYLSWFLVASQVVLMGPQTYYAILTMRKNHWGTR